MNANALRMIASAGGGLVAIYWFNLGIAGFFAAVAAGFCLYAAMMVHAVSNVKTPNTALAGCDNGRADAVPSSKRANSERLSFW